MDAPKYEITQSIAILSTEKSGWTKELNLIAWNGKAPKYDILKDCFIFDNSNPVGGLSPKGGIFHVGAQDGFASGSCFFRPLKAHELLPVPRMLLSYVFGLIRPQCHWKSLPAHRI